ncbi:MAG: c-type cytochrome [Thiohalomonadaceae bacterium]
MQFIWAFLLLLPNLTASAAPNGAELYAQNCAACHGSDGRGGVGVPLALPSFLNSVDDGYLDTTIRLGRPGRVMPAFAMLNAAERRAIVAHLRSWQDKDSPRLLLTDYRPGSGDVVRGKKLFGQHCSSCHGERGEGGHGTGVTFSRPRDMPIIAPALNNPGFLAAASDQMIKATLINGREGTPMVSFLQQGLREQDIDDIIAFVRSFALTQGWQPGSQDETWLEMESSYTLEETVEAVKRAALGKNFRIIREQWLEDGFFAEEEQHREANIIYFCNFTFINQALTMDPRVGLFMPCRITVVEHEGQVKMMSINPKYMSGLFNNAELDEPCEEMYQVYLGIMEEASL